MMISGSSFILSPSDLTTSAACEFAWMRVVDGKLGRTAAVKFEADAMLARTAELGDRHEQRHLATLVEGHGDGVVQLAAPQPYDAETLAAAHATTIAHLQAGAPVVYQAAFYDGSFGGLADFIVRAADGRYEVRDTKLARHAKVPALLQIAAYAHQLDLAGIPRASVGTLVLGDGEVHAQDLDEIVPVYLQRRAKLESMLREHLAKDGPVEWNDPRYSFCGSCDACAAEVEAHDDLLKVAGMRKTQRAKLRSAGLTTSSALANSTGPVEGLNPAILEGLRTQARLQGAPTLVDGRAIPSHELIDSGRAIKLLPPPSAGDIFFDFEGDPLWSDAAGSEWGLEYLFGVIEPVEDGVFKSWWAHDRAAERQALVDFLDYVTARRADHPDMRVYHYASYEVTALKRLVGQHGTHEDQLDVLLRAGVFVDLYQTVRQGVRVGSESYSIKKLEPLYMGDDLRTGLDNAADSIVEYHRYCEAVAAGANAQAAEILEGITDYNRYDCVSTWRLRDWLRGLVGGSTPLDPTPVEDRPSSERAARIAPMVELLKWHAGEPGHRTNDQQAVALVAASLGFHRREALPFWWGFFDRFQSSPEEWLEPRDFVIAEQSELLEDWHLQPGKKVAARRVRVVGRLEPASSLGVGTSVTGIYEQIPAGLAPEPGHGRCAGGGADIERVGVTSDGLDELVIRERIATGCGPWPELPMAWCVPSTVPAKSIEDALEASAQQLLSTLPAWPSAPGFDLLRRLPPRLTTGALPEVGVAAEDAIHAALHALDHSYLAVQGPPGTGKTYVGSRVVRHLVEAGWKVGVVAQSHAVVENFMSAAVGAGLDPSVMAKPKARDDDPWPDLNGVALEAFTSEEGGRLIGGTAWTFTNRNAVGDGQLDLLVIDEAGQFSLANTLAVSTSAQRLLLLGDPQQLPQVSQGTHPEPVDTSALRWIIGDHETMPPDRGYFLERTWRMHSDLTALVSQLAYASRLRSHEPVTDARDLEALAPGVHTLEIEHEGNAQASAEEATAIADLVASLVGRSWKPSADGQHRSMTAADVLVVAPYNAQVATIRRHLDHAGHSETRVGTVDKFQGQEAPVVIVSMTASSPDDVPRGMGFLLNRNRLNVAISRGQWATFIVHSPRLSDFLPSTPAGLAELGAFLRVLRLEEDSG